jgi:O-antigen/teichoic acid export membrane protein
MGYFNLIFWMVNITASVGTFGLPVTTRKYMAEHLGRGEPGVARAIYGLALRIQTTIALAVTLGALVLVFAIGDPAHRLISVLLIGSVAPRMIGAIPSQANNAAELMKRNTQPSLIATAVNIAVTLFSLWIGWDLVGVSAGFTGAVLLETWLKLRSARDLLRGIAPQAIAPELKRRMFAYSGREIALMLLNVVVWDRSDVVILNHLNPDIRQVTFFSQAFGITERILLMPNSFVAALGVTIMAQHGRDEDRSRSIAVAGAKYAFLMALPLMAGIAAISGPLVPLLFGNAYVPMAPVLAIIALLAIPKGLTTPASMLLRSAGNQGFLIWVGAVGGALKVALDILLTRSHGAVGAALANGIAQAAAAAAIWIYVQRLYRIDLRLRDFGRIALSGIVMAAAAHGIVRVVPGAAGVAAAIVAAAVIWFAMLRLTGALNSADADRLRSMSRVAPAPVRPVFVRMVGLLVGAGAAHKAPVSR